MEPRSKCRATWSGPGFSAIIRDAQADDAEDVVATLERRNPLLARGGVVLASR